MDSFYSGLPGTPFVLRARFSDVEEMNTAFEKGEAYKGVFYGEYCIIDSPNKSHQNNGKIFRRGYTGPEYIGQVAGPSGNGLFNLRIWTHGKDDVDKNKQNIPVYKAETVMQAIRQGDNIKGKHITWKQDSDFDGLEPPAYEVLKPSKYKDNFQYIVYDTEKAVTSDENGNPVYEYYTCFLGFYDVLEDLIIDEEGKIQRQYTSTETSNENKSINGIKQIWYDKDAENNNKTADFWICFSYIPDGYEEGISNSFMEEHEGVSEGYWIKAGTFPHIDVNLGNTTIESYLKQIYDSTGSDDSNKIIRILKGDIATNTGNISTINSSITTLNNNISNIRNFNQQKSDTDNTVKDTVLKSNIDTEINQIIYGPNNIPTSSTPTIGSRITTLESNYVTLNANSIPNPETLDSLISRWSDN